jgi:hypothetical protein
LWIIFGCTAVFPRSPFHNAAKQTASDFFSSGQHSLPAQIVINQKADGKKQALTDVLKSELRALVENFPEHFYTFLRGNIKKSGHYVCDSLFGRTCTANWFRANPTFHMSMMKAFYANVNDSILNAINHLPIDGGNRPTRLCALQRHSGKTLPLLRVTWSIRYLMC